MGNSNTLTDSIITQTGSSPSQIIRITSNSDAQLRLDGSTTSWAGIHWVDVNGSDYMWFSGSSGTFAFGGGGSNVSGKKLHIDGSTSIGSNYDTASPPTNGLVVEGGVGIGTGSPFSKLQVGSNTFDGANGMYSNARVGISNHGGLTGMMLASTYNASTHPEYGLVFVQGPSTSSYNVWSISPDGPAKGDSLSFIYQLQGTNIHSTTPKVVFDGNGNVGIGPTSKAWVPEAKLVVKDSQDAAFNKGIAFERSNTTQSGYLNMVGGAMNIVSYDNLPIKFRTGSNAANTPMTIEAGGNVGVGITSPNAKLEVQGPNITSGTPVDLKKFNAITTSLATSAYYGGFAQFWVGRYANTSNHSKTSLVISLNDGLYSSSTSNADTDVMTLLASGDVGIGTTSPKSKLQVAGGIQMADDTDTASADKVGTMRYRESGGVSYADMVMKIQGGYAWVNIVQNIFTTP